MLKLALVIVGLLVAAAIAWTLASATTTTASGTRKPRCPEGCQNTVRAPNPSFGTLQGGGNALSAARAT
jgi:hypothetical protein